MPSFAIMSDEPLVFRPLDWIEPVGPDGALLEVTDSRGRVVCSGPLRRFRVGGALGEFKARAWLADGSWEETSSFTLEAETVIEDKEGVFADLSQMCLDTILNDCEGVGAVREYNGVSYPCFVQWVLDHVNVAKGARWFWPGTGGLVELWAAAQNPDGMVWSFVEPGGGHHYFLDAYRPYGYAKEEGGLTIVRQPVENHNEYMFVNGLYMAWQGVDDPRSMEKLIDAGMRALNYTLGTPVRWSVKHQLLKRAYTIDSWDFQIDDGHLVEFPLGSSQLIDPERTKFGVFFGDCHGYALACQELSQMLRSVGRLQEAEELEERSKGILNRVKALAWNGRFFRHWVPEDESVARDLGVDESSQLAMSNGYALNRGIDRESAEGILSTYEAFRQALPPGSPGEWYAIYPPFERGVGHDNHKWQYMNGGVHGHAAGEFARGAFRWGHETYGVDILKRLQKLGEAHGRRIFFAYTGASLPDPEPVAYTPLSLGDEAKMSLDCSGDFPWLNGGGGNDMAGLPRGKVTLAGIPFTVDRAAGVGHSDPYAAEVRIETGAKLAGAVCLLHSSSGGSWSHLPQVVGHLVLEHEDGSEDVLPIEQGRHVTGWWYPSLEGDRAGVAWRGPNGKSSDVGVCWCVIENPQPLKPLARVHLRSASDPARVWAVAAVTLADRLPDLPVDPVSTGGPDNWSAGCVLAALVEGLAGVEDGGQGMKSVTVTPRWGFAGSAGAKVVARYADGSGYVAYEWEETPVGMRIVATGSGDAVRLRIPLQGRNLSSVRIDDVDHGDASLVMEEGHLCLALCPSRPVEIVLVWERQP
jgi:hypothetical protein